MNLPLLQNDREVIPNFGSGELIKESVSTWPDWSSKIPGFVRTRGEPSLQHADRNHANLVTVQRSRLDVGWNDGILYSVVLSSSKTDKPIGISSEQLASLDSDQAAAIFEHGNDAVIFALLAMAKQLALAEAASDDPATPPGMVLVYQKPPPGVAGKNRSPGPGTSAAAVPNRIASTMTARIRRQRIAESDIGIVPK